MSKGIPQILCGDILLLNGIGITSKLNRGSQFALRLSRSKYTHVALCLGNNVIMHAMPDNGVHPIEANELLNNYGNKWIAIRNKKVAWEAKNDLPNVYKKALFHIGKPYKLLSLLKNRKIKKAAVCSNYISMFLDSLNVNVNRKPFNVMPSDFQKLLNTKDWEDVTDEHRNYYDLTKEHTCHAKHEIRSIEQSKDLASIVQNNLTSMKGIDDAFRCLNKALGIKTKHISIPIPKLDYDYWDVDD